MLEKLLSLFGFGRKRARLVVKVSPGRGSCGALRAFDADGRELLQRPIAVAARADDSLARRHANPGRDVMLPYGDPPAGTYLLIALDRLEGAPEALREELGECQLLFEPSEGDAARAEAGGRLLLALHGGRVGRDEGLRPTAGGLRVSDADLARLLRLLQNEAEWRLELLEEAPSMLPSLLSTDPAGEAIDPPVAFSAHARRAMERRGAPSPDGDDDSWRPRDDDWSSSETYSTSAPAVAAAVGVAAQASRAQELQEPPQPAESQALGEEARAEESAPQEPSAAEEAGASEAPATESTESGTSY